MFNIAITPVIWVSGWLYMFYNDLADWGLDGVVSLSAVALVHVAAAFAMLVFFVVHIYVAFTGHPPSQYVKAMITGFDDVYPVEQGAQR